MRKGIMMKIRRIDIRPGDVVKLDAKFLQDAKARDLIFDNHPVMVYAVRGNNMLGLLL